MHLIATLGSSFAVIPEAYLMGNSESRYDTVSVITTTSTVESVGECRDWFKNFYPSVDLHIYSIAELDDITNEHHHHIFEEALFRLYFHVLEKATSCQQIHLCLAGGFKTMSSATHQCADLLGCGKLFHITAPSPSLNVITSELQKNKLHPDLNLVDLGMRPGWPTIQAFSAQATAIAPDTEPFIIENTNLRDCIIQQLRTANRLAQSEPELATLSFPQLARWSPADRDWLSQPLDPETDKQWVADLPKLELHCHLGGFATHGEELKTVRAAASSPLESIEQHKHPTDWPEPLDNITLSDYCKLGDNNGSRLLKDPGCLYKQIELLYVHFQEQNIHYAEVRCSPANYATSDRSPWTILSEIITTFNACKENASKQEHRAPSVNLIIIATRLTTGDFRTGISKHLALAASAADHWTDLSKTHVVGVDLAGYESEGTRAHYFREEFVSAHRAGLPITIHAGENDDAEGIWSAVIDLNANRLGHALRLTESPKLLKAVADRRIGIEMCPYANYQIVGFNRHIKHPTDKHYPLLKYLDAGVAVTINTDNIGISAASLTENYLFLAQLCPGITRLQILTLLRNAVDQAFITVDRRHKLLAKHIPLPPTPNSPS